MLFACAQVFPLAQAPCTAPSSLRTPSLPSFLKLCSWTCLPVPAWLFRTVTPRSLLQPPLACRGLLLVTKTCGDALDLRNVWWLWRQTHRSWDSPEAEPEAGYSARACCPASPASRFPGCCSAHFSLPSPGVMPGSPSSFPAGMVSYNIPFTAMIYTHFQSRRMWRVS